MLSYTQLQSDFSTLSQNSTPANLALGAHLMNLEQRYLLQKYFSNEGSYTMSTVSQQQFYNMPPNYSKLKTITITNGSLKWTPTEVLSRVEWDRLNVFPYYADIPNNFFIYPGGDHGGQVGIWPIPSSAGMTLTYNYKFRIPDLSIADTTGTASVTTLTTAVTGTGFVPTVNSQSEARWIQFAQPTGDNLWYQIASINSSTSLTLFAPYQGATISGGNYTIGQMPLLQEDFHDMLLYKALVYYFSTIVDNKGKREQFQAIYDSKLELLAEYSDSNTVNVNLGRRTTQRNPNLYQYNNLG